jgi:hypothetical protein
MAFKTLWADLRIHGWTLAFYALLGGILLLQQRVNFTVHTDTLILLGLVLLPIILPWISKLEFGGVKVELRRLRNEVMEAKNELRKDVGEVRETYHQLTARLAELSNRTADYLKPQPLEISEQQIKTMEGDVFKSPLDDTDVDQALSSLDPSVRIPGYLELRIRPREPFFEPLLDCFWLEFVYSRRHPKHYTRPLWQLLKAAGRFHEQDEKYPRQAILGFPEAERRRFALILKHTMEVLESDEKLDPGGQCKSLTTQIIKGLQ